MTTEPTYDAVTCITAGELREMGIAIPANVPDCGWIPRGAMQMRAGTAHQHSEAEIAAGILRVNLECTFTQPFRWIELDVVIHKPGTS